jgi:hypothetical protein
MFIFLKPSIIYSLGSPFSPCPPHSTLATSFCHFIIVFKCGNIFIRVSCITSIILLKNVLTRRKESDIYLAPVSRHRWSMQIVMKVDKMCSFQPALWPSSAEEEDYNTVLDIYKFSNFQVHNFRFPCCYFINSPFL